MSFSEHNHIAQKACLGLETIEKCVDCQAKLRAEGEHFICSECHRNYTQNNNGVWDFRQSNTGQSRPQIYEEAEFKRWIKIFREEESKNWVIYKNPLFRFFAQAGHRVIAKKMNQTQKADKVVLELGAGTGTLLNYLPSENFVAVDMSMESLEILKSQWPNATCVCASGSALPFKPNSFDQVVSLHTLEHIYFLAEALQELKRVTRKGGQMHYVIPTEGGLAFSLGRKFITGPHVRKKYNLDVQYVMDREHINDANRVIKFLRMHFDTVERRFWPVPFLKLLSINAIIYGECRNLEASENNND